MGVTLLSAMRRALYSSLDRAIANTGNAGRGEVDDATDIAIRVVESKTKRLKQRERRGRARAASKQGSGGDRSCESEGLWVWRMETFKNGMEMFLCG